MKIWKYWEGPMPSYVERLLYQTNKYSKHEVVILNEKNVWDYVPELSLDVFKLEKIAHRADVIRSYILMKYGGVWTDADIIFVKNLDFHFDLLDDYNLVCYNETCTMDPEHRLRIGLLASTPHSQPVIDWNRRQVEFIKKYKRFHWTAIGADMLFEAAKPYANKVKILDIYRSEPIYWSDEQKFHANLNPADFIKDDTISFSFHNSRQTNKNFGAQTLGGRLLDLYA